MGAQVAQAPAGRIVGQPLPGRDDERVLRGQTQYLDDLTMPGLAHAAFVRSPLAHARVNHVRVPSEAPGLLAVVTGADLGDRVRPFPIQVPPGVEVADEPHPVLAIDEVRYAGQAVAVVVAEARALAEDLAELVEVDYEPLDVALDARAPGAPLARWSRRTGDVDGEFARAELVVRATHSIPRLVASPMEPRGAVASFDAGADQLTIWLSAQDPHRPLFQLAHALRRPEESIRVVVPDVGGAFGSKGVAPPESAALAIAAMQLGRPIKWTEDRSENFLAAYQGRGVEADLELALASDGRMLALRARIFADLGGYLLTTTAIPPHTMAMLMTGVYEIDSADVELVGALTHRVPTGPYRGAGRPEAAYALELTVDEAARQLGISPSELRKRNLIREFPHETPLGFVYDSGDYERCLDRALELAAFDGCDAGEGRLLGTGVAMYVERAGGRWESARVSLAADGRATVSSSSSPHGQGHGTVFAQIAAERLGVGPDDVTVRFGELPGVGTFGSRSVAVAGSAVALAIDELRERCRPIAARLLDAPENEIAWTDDGRLASTDGRELSLREVAAAAGKPRLEATVRFDSEQVFSSGAYAAAVAIDPDTGRLEVLRLVAVDDAGTIVNPLLAEGQVIGGSVQGLAAVLLEEAAYDPSGQPLTTTFANYGLPAAPDVPHIEADFVASPSPLNPLGAKGIGEAGAIGTPAAVGNAVADALGGRMVDPPYTPEKLWRALKEKE